MRQRESLERLTRKTPALEANHRQRKGGLARLLFGLFWEEGLDFSVRLTTMKNGGQT
jgi:hypothetical protein